MKYYYKKNYIFSPTNFCFLRPNSLAPYPDKWLDKNDIYAMLKDKIDTALKQSETLRVRNKNTDSSDYTMCNVDLLISEIQKLGKK